MLNDLAYLIVYIGILIAVIIPMGLIAWAVVSLIPDSVIEHWRTGKTTLANDRYTTRRIKVDKQVYRSGKNTHPA